MRKLLLALLLLPTLANGAVFICVDPQTGKKSFTDRACPKNETGNEVRVNATNFGHGVRDSGPDGPKAWNSQRDQRRDAEETRGPHSFSSSFVLRGSSPSRGGSMSSAGRAMT